MSINAQKTMLEEKTVKVELGESLLEMGPACLLTPTLILPHLT